MSSEKLFVDSSTIIIGIKNPNSNSSLVLDLIREKKVEAITSQKALEEVTEFFSINNGKNFGSKVNFFVKQFFVVIPRHVVQKEIKKFADKIKDKDLEHLATSKFAGAKIVAVDKHFKPFKEYLTPKQMIQKLGLKPYDTDF